MRSLFLGCSFCMAVMGSELAAGAAQNSLESEMGYPLILGASVSADQNSLSPGKKLAKRLNPNSDIKVVAKGGTTGLELLRSVKDASFEGRSSVIALDLFFWDSGLPDSAPSIAALKKLVAIAKSKKLPLALGSIPELLKGRQPGREKLNAAIEQECAAYSACAVMPFDELHKKLLKDGFLEIEGKRRTFKEMAPDGLHLAGFAGDYLAKKLEEILQARWGH